MNSLKKNNIFLCVKEIIISLFKNHFVNHSERAPLSIDESDDDDDCNRILFILIGNYINNFVVIMSIISFFMLRFHYVCLNITRAR